MSQSLRELIFPHISQETSLAMLRLGHVSLYHYHKYSLVTILNFVIVVMDTYCVEIYIS